MLRSLPFLLLALSSFACEAPQERKEQQEKEKPSSFKKEFSAIWEHATTYTLEVLDPMPADKLGTKPADSSMSFRQQLFHLESNIHGLTDRYILEKDSSSHVSHDPGVSKGDLRKRLKSAFGKVEKALNELSSKELRDTTLLFDRMKVPKTRVFLLIRDHMTHHRAQMIVALREAGQEPPEYRGW